jgi:hypothetical protein
MDYNVVANALGLPRAVICRHPISRQADGGNGFRKKSHASGN